MNTSGAETLAATTGPSTLVVEDDPDVAALLVHTLEIAGHHVVCASDGMAALHVAPTLRPDLVLLDCGLPDVSGSEVCRALRADFTTSSSGIIIVTGRNSLADVEAGFDAGADDYIIKPFRPRELLARAQSLLRRGKELRGLSPLTGLPGNFVILSEIARLLAVGVPFALIYADLDNFKAYNDRYGFLQGDDAILVTANCLKAALQDVETEPRFLGHVGGDDFVLLVGSDSAERVASEAAERFDAAAPLLYDDVDIERGHLITTTRGSSACETPLMTISMGIASTLIRDVKSAHEVVAAATELKAMAKSSPGSCWRVDRRRA